MTHLELVLADIKIIQKYFEEKQHDMYEGTLENNPAYGTLPLDVCR